MPGYRELYCVSDLHIGGCLPHQIFDHGALLASTIDAVRERPGPGVGLVLNGDIVDFLAEPGASYLNPRGAVAALERIFADPSFAAVWAALAKFARTPGHELVVVLGNHDVELALPEVRERLVAELAGQDEPARARIRFATDGAGFSCHVGAGEGSGAKVLVVHGNEFDSWNAIDHLQLLQMARALNRGSPVPDWTPNAGTQMVIDVMNDVKRQLPFVDLLKPEGKILVAVLYAADPSLLGRLGALVPVLARKAADAFRMQTGLLGTEGPADAPGESLGGWLADTLGPAGPGGKALEASIREDWYRRDQDPVNLAWRNQAEMLGLGGLIRDKICGRNPRENLREALAAWVGKDESFDVGSDRNETTFAALDKEAGRDIDVVIAGHTHLRRALPRQRASGIYFNTGTWIRLIGLTPAQVATPEAFAPLYTALMAGTMQALDNTFGLVRREPTVARVIAAGDGRVVAELCDAAAGHPGILLPIPRAQRWESR